MLARPNEEGGAEKYTLLYKTTEQQHTFNMPYQLGAYSKDLPKDGDFKTFDVKHGDVIVMATGNHLVP
jgi:hypothetical protein